VEGIIIGSFALFLLMLALSVSCFYDLFFGQVEKISQIVDLLIE
jgi:hypothetical protein